MGRQPATIRNANVETCAWLPGLLPELLRWFVVAVLVLLTCAVSRAQSGVITTVVGPGLRGSAGGNTLSLPSGVAVSGSGPGAVIYTADATNCVVWQTQSDQTSIYAGELGQCAGGSPGSSPTTTSLIYPVSLALCGGDLFIASNGIDPYVFNTSTDTGGSVVEVDASGNITALPLGGVYGGGPLHPVAIACDANGNVYVSSYFYIADGGFSGNIQELSPASGGGWTTASLVSTTFDEAYPAIAIDPSSGDLYGVLAGQAGEGWLGAPKLSLGTIWNITQNMEAQVEPNSFINVSGLATEPYQASVPNDNCQLVGTTEVCTPNFVVSVSSELDQYSSEVELVSPGGGELAPSTITVLAGTGTPGYSGDGGLATNAQVNGVSEMTLDSQGYLYMADSENQRIRKIHPLTAGPTALNLVSGSVPQSSGPQFDSLQGVLNPTTGDFYYVAGANTVNVINTGAGIDCTGCERVFAAIPVGANNGGSASTLTMAVDPTQNLVYVSNTADGKLYVIDGNPGTSTSYTVLNTNGLLLENTGANLLAIDTGLDEIYAAGPSSTTVSAVRGGRVLSLIGNTPSLEAPVQSISVDTASHAIYAMGTLVEGYGGEFPLLYTLTPAGDGTLSLDTTQIAAVGEALPTGNFHTNSIASDPQSGSLLVSGGGYYNPTVDEYIAFDIFTFSPGMSEAPLPYPWQPFTTSLDAPDRAFYITDFDGNLNDSSSNATMIIGMDSVAIGNNTLASTAIPVFGGTVSSPQTAPSPHVYDIEPDTSSYQAWISGSDANDGGFVKLWDSSTQAITLSAAIPSLGGGHLFVDSTNHAAYLLDHVNGDLWLINKPQWTGTVAPQLTQSSGSSLAISTSNPADTVYYTLDGSPPGPGLSPTTASCTSPCSVSLSMGVFTTVNAIDVDASSGTPIASNVAQGVFTAVAPTSLTVAVAPSPATTGATITATATITPAIGITSVAGTVSFTATPFGSSTTASLCAQISVVNNAGSWQAACTFTEGAAGSYAINAVYSGDSLNQGSSNAVALTVNEGTTPVLGAISGDSGAVAINSNNTPGLTYNAVLNSDSSVGLLQNGSLLPGQGCPAYTVSGSAITLSTGAIYVDFANSNIYLAMIAGNGLYAAYESIDPTTGACTQGPLLTLSSGSNSYVEMNVDVAQGNMYVANTFGANFDELYIVPIAPWNPSTLPTPAQVQLDYSAQYGPIVIDPSNHNVYINDLGDSAYGSAGTYATSGFFVYSPTQSATPANNLQHVVGCISCGTTTAFNVGTLLNNGAGKLVLVSENPSASSANLSKPVIVLDTTQFSFFTSTQPGSAANTVDITPGSGFSQISAASQYTAIGGADINPSANLVYVYAYNSTVPSNPGLLLAYNLAPGASPAETVLSSSMAQPRMYDSQGPWSELNYDAESTEIVLSANQYGSGALGVVSPLCAGGVSLTQLVGNQGSPTPLDYPAVNTASGFTYAILPASSYPPVGSLYFVAPPPSGCSTSSSSPILISPIVLPAGAVNIPYSQNLGATGGSGTGYTWSVQFGTALSAVGLTLSPSGTISGSPTGLETDAPLIVQVTDSMGNTATQAYLLTINSTSSEVAIVNDGETITVNDAPQLQVTDVNDPETITVTDTVSVTVAGASTLTMTLAATPAGTTVNGSVTLGATVTTTGSTPPSGSVTFSLKGAALPGCTLVPVNGSGVATCTTNTLPLGQNTITASYSNDPTLGSAQATTVVNVTQASLSMTLTASPANPSVDTPVILTAAVTPNPSGPTPPSGSVTFSLNGTALPGCALVAVAANQAICNDSALPAGEDTITAVYSNDPNFASAQATVSVNVGKASTTTQLIETVSSAAGYDSTFTATIMPSTSGIPTGTVTFYDGTTSIGTGALANGVAALTTDTLPGGSDQITAVYSGDTNFTGSTSNAISVQVADFSVAFVSLPSTTISPGGSATYTLTVTPGGSYANAVTFTVSGLPAGATATFNPPTVTPGSSPVNVTLTITLPAAQALAHPAGRMPAGAPLVLVLLLPLAGLGRLRRKLSSRTWFAMLAVFSLAAMAGLGACGGHGSSTPSPQTYTVTVTATSGAAQQSTTFNLTVE